MIIQFSVENFRSIAEKQTLHMTADVGSELRDNLIVIDQPKKIELVRSAAIYGANAAGKSNVIQAITTMAEVIVSGSSGKNIVQESSIPKFKLDKAFSNKPTEFELDFIASGVRYQYGFSIFENIIHDEWLYAYPKGRPQKWFVRVWDKEKKKHIWELGSSLAGEKNTWMKSTREDALFLSTAVQLNSKQLKDVYDWFYLKLRFTELSGWNEDYTAEQCYAGKKDQVLKFLKAADIGIDDIVVTKEKFNPNSLPDDLPDALKDLVIRGRQDKDDYIIKTLHKNSEGDLISFNYEDESHGTKKLFNFSGPLLHTLTTGNVMIIDEMNDKLHPKLVEFIVSAFNNVSINTSGAQLIFTTHETSILNQNIFRRDQIWFVEKSTNGATRLYPLTEFSPRKGRENLEMAYMDGRYGGVPIVGKLKEIYGN